MGAADWEAEGLLEGLDGDRRRERAELLDWLHDQGFSVERLREAAAEGTLFFLPAERIVGGDAKYTARELAERFGVDLDFLARMRRAHGLPVPGPDERVFGEVDLDGLRNARAFLDAGIDPEDMITVGRVLGRGLAQATEVMRQITLKLAREPGTTELELAQRLADIAGQLIPMTEPMLNQMLRLHLRDMVRTEAAGATERMAGGLPGAVRIAVAFADLVGFTRLGEEVAPDELGRIARDLEDMATDLVDRPVRLVKTIGDAVMLVADEPAPLVETGLALVEAADRRGHDFPQLHAGLALGAALSRGGDWYGHPVNLASRVTAVARPGSVLCTDDVHEAAEAGYRWSFAGRRPLKGIQGAVPLFRARRLEAEDR